MNANNYPYSNYHGRANPPKHSSYISNGSIGVSLVFFSLLFLGGICMLINWLLSIF